MQQLDQGMNLNPTRWQLMQAASAWCNDKDEAQLRTYQSEYQYFYNNWESLPGLRHYVERVVERDANGKE